MVNGGISAELYKAITAIVDDRVKEIRVTRGDFNELQGIVRELAQAQARTEKRVEELAQAQTRTEEELRNLARQIGKLSDNIDFGLEDIARVVLPGYLERHLDVWMVEELDRRFFVVDGEEIEMNIYGEGRKNGKEIIVLGEAKSRIYEREVREFIQKVAKVLPTIKKDVLKIMFGYLVHPSATKLGEVEKIILVASYQR
jgi:hypothetical protein